MSDYDLEGYHNPKRPRDPKAVRTISPLPEVLRKFCYRCWKAGDLCLCPHVQVVHNQLEIGLVFHPRERKNPINTGRLAFLSLEKTWAATGVELDEVADYTREIERFEPGEIGVLYPSNEATDLSEAPESLKCLIVVDGTWNEAKKMIHRTPSLKAMPHYAFTPAQESNYRIRKEPAPHCVSTIEAVVTSLRAYDSGIEPLDQRREDSSKAPYQELLDLFDRMIDNQIRCKEEHSHSRHKERQERAYESWRHGALNWLHLSMPQEQKSYIQNHLSEEDYLSKLEELKTPEAVVEWVKWIQQRS